MCVHACACTYVRVRSCVRVFVHAQEEECLSQRVYMFFFLVGLSANGLKTNVPLKFSSHRDAVPPTRLAVFLCSNKIAGKKVVQLHWTQPLLKLLRDCMDCFHIKIPEVVFPLECSTFSSSEAIFSSPMTLPLDAQSSSSPGSFVGEITSSNRCVPNFNDPRAVCMVNTTASQITALWFVPRFWQKAWLTRYFSPVCLPWPSTSTILFLKLPSRVFCFCCDSPDSWKNHTLAYVVRHCLRQDPLEAILVIFGRRALIFFVWKVLEKLKMTHFCAHAQWWSPWRRNNVEKGHLTPSSLTFLIIAIDKNGFRRLKEGQIYTKLPQIFQFLPGDLVMIFQSLVTILPLFFGFERP